MKSVIRLLLLVLGIIFCLISLSIPLSAPQIAENKMSLADMRDCVRAIKEFEKKSGRLPNEDELSRIEDSVPRRYSLRYGFKFGTPPSERGVAFSDPTLAPAPKGWMIWYWRGEWSEWYTSWDDHYSLQDQASWWAFCGLLLFAPFIAAGFFCLRSLKVLKVKRVTHSLVC